MRQAALSCSDSVTEGGRRRDERLRRLKRPTGASGTPTWARGTGAADRPGAGRVEYRARPAEVEDPETARRGPATGASRGRSIWEGRCPVDRAVSEQPRGHSAAAIRGWLDASGQIMLMMREARLLCGTSPGDGELAAARSTWNCTRS